MERETSVSHGEVSEIIQDVTQDLEARVDAQETKLEELKEGVEDNQQEISLLKQELNMAYKANEKVQDFEAEILKLKEEFNEERKAEALKRESEVDSKDQRIKDLEETVRTLTEQMANLQNQIGQSARPEPPHRREQEYKSFQEEVEELWRVYMNEESVRGDTKETVQKICEKYEKTLKSFSWEYEREKFEKGGMMGKMGKRKRWNTEVVPTIQESFSE
mmetsp:Transcript_55766/g.63655  ORF Transcript_55766/g.63655 Transcript_55766/m.63655 type:complete len:219 (-) Transcript_55766:56-712(-)